MPHFQNSFLHPRFQLDACTATASLDDVLSEREARVAQRETLRKRIRQSLSEREARRGTCEDPAKKFVPKRIKGVFPDQVKEVFPHRDGSSFTQSFSAPTPARFGRPKQIRRFYGQSSQYSYSLLSFSLNLAGPHKRSPLADFFFTAALTLLTGELSRRFGKLEEPQIRAGRAGAWALLEVPTDAQSCKAFCLELEDGLPAGILWDLDVYDLENGQKLSRKALGWEERPCLICGRKVSFCARSRAHSWQELERESSRLMKEALLSEVAAALWLAAEKSLFYEALATPKAGLVDRLDQGAHTDMNIYSFVDSSLALGSSLRKFIEAGMASSSAKREKTSASSGETTNSAQRREISSEFREKAIPVLSASSGFTGKKDSDQIVSFKTLAALGQEAERSMFRASGGVNTQQGLIFSLGFLLSTAGRRLRERVEALDGALEQRESDELHQNVTQGLLPTAAELAAEASALAASFLDWRGDSEESRQRGARAAVLNGYGESLSALTILRRERAEGGDEDESSLAALLYLMSCIEDSNILRRAALRHHAQAQGDGEKAGSGESKGAKTWEEMSQGEKLSGENLEGKKARELSLAAQEELCQLKKRAAEILNLPRKARRDACCIWNQELCRKGLSPGGAADQLALTRFFDFLEAELTQTSDAISC